MTSDCFGLSPACAIGAPFFTEYAFFKGAASTYISVAVAELLLAVGKSPHVNQFERNHVLSN